MEDELKNLPKPTQGLKAIFIFHDPPYGIELDCCKDGDVVGSKAMAKFIEESNAYMSFHGHIHESPEVSEKWVNKLGNKICMQPEQTEFENSKLHYVIVDTDSNTYELKFDE